MTFIPTEVTGNIMVHIPSPKLHNIFTSHSSLPSIWLKHAPMRSPFSLVHLDPKLWSTAIKSLNKGNEFEMLKHFGSNIFKTIESLIDTYKKKTSIFLNSTKREVSIFEPEFEATFNELIKKERQHHFEYRYDDEKIKNTQPFTLKQILNSSDKEFESIVKDYKIFYWGDTSQFTIPVANHFIAIGEYWRAKKIVLAVWNYHASYGSYNPYQSLFEMMIRVAILYPENFVEMICEAITIFDGDDSLELSLGKVDPKILKALEFLSERIGFELVQDSTLHLIGLGILAHNSCQWFRNIPKEELETYPTEIKSFVEQTMDIDEDDEDERFETWKIIEEDTFKRWILLNPTLKRLKTKKKLFE